MGQKNLLTPVLSLLLIVHYVTAIQWDYEFGKKQRLDAAKIYEKEGTIHIFQYRNFYSFTVPVGMQVSYVRVTVWGLSPPKVDYDESTHTVSIVYSFMQITLSTFKIQVEGVPFVIGSNAVKVSLSSGELPQSNEING
ncbi:uncharacterized protein LOC133528454 [Cydia pomonella]|uniref:uncharacterized protein LOC133528454 n=1 Tax=Cydia pomonella TaxID=82600 RepID=UPI002ADE0817|nr:uncharacterized protein LOC133528454 [Cydia pomonella]